MLKTVTENFIERIIFREHITHAVSLICILLGVISVITPLFYEVNPWTGVIFTAASIWAHQKVKREESYKIAAVVIIIVLTLSALLFAFIHGLHGALSFFLILLSGIVASLTLGERVGMILLVFAYLMLILLATYQFPQRSLHEATPVLPDVIIALCISASFYIIIRMFNKYLTYLSIQEYRYQKELKVYNLHMDYLVREKVRVSKSEIRAQLRKMKSLAKTASDLGGLTHDISNTLTSLRLVLDQNIERLPEPDRRRIEENFNNLRLMLQRKSMRNHIKREKSEVLAIVQNLVETQQYNLAKKDINIKTRVEKAVLELKPIELQRILSNLIQNSIDALSQKEEGRKVILIEGKKLRDIYLISVEDSGKGIPKELLHLISKPWFTTKGKNHMGLGLSNITEILKRNNYEPMQIKSIRNRGTKILFKIPIRE